MSRQFKSFAVAAGGIVPVCAFALSVAFAGSTKGPCRCQYAKCITAGSVQTTCGYGETCACCSVAGGAWTCTCCTVAFNCTTPPGNTICND